MNHFLIAKQHLVDTGEIVQSGHGTTMTQPASRSWRFWATSGWLTTYGQMTLSRCVDTFAKSRGIVTLGQRRIRRARILFKYAYRRDLIEQPSPLRTVVQATKPQGIAEGPSREGAANVPG